jgi:hypothetical protein
MHALTASSGGRPRTGDRRVGVADLGYPTALMALPPPPGPFRRRADGTDAARAPGVPGAFHAPVMLARRVANWPPGTPVTIVEPFGESVMVEVSDAEGDTLDVLVFGRRLLTV